MNLGGDDLPISTIAPHSSRIELVQDFKVSLGYRADFFFNSMDGGIEAPKSEDRGFDGPFVSIRVGIGD